jgi:predicted Zn-dependent protease
METLSWLPILWIIALIIQAVLISLGLGFDETRILNNVMQDLLNLILRLPHSRAVETEADLVGCELLLRSGLPVEDYPRVLALLQSQGAEWFSTHPAPERRSAAIRQHLLQHHAELSPEPNERFNLIKLVNHSDNIFGNFYERPKRLVVKDIFG